MTNAVSIAQSGSNNVTFRNRFINGAMVINQRAFSGNPSSDQQYTLDRWNARLTQTGKFSVTQSTDAPAGFLNSMLCTSLSAYSVTSTDYFGVAQYIEASNLLDLGWGTANAKTITMSFWAKSSLTGTFGGTLFAYNSGVPSYPFSYTINAANTWEYKTVTVPGPTSGTWYTANTDGYVAISWSIGTGTSVSGTANTWNYSTLYRAPTGSTSVVGTNGATFQITGAQFETGSTASPFEYRLYGTELALCQRYYEVIYANSASFILIAYYSALSNDNRTAYQFKVTKRANPSFSLLSGAAWANATPTIYYSVNGFEFFSATPQYYIYTGSAWAAAVGISAEL